MSLSFNIIFNIYSILILLIIYYQCYKQSEKESVQYKVFTLMLIFTIVMLVLDVLSRFDGRPDTIYPYINQLGNFLIFLMNPVMPSLWLLYVHFQVFQDKRRIKRLIYLLLFLNAVNGVLLVLTQFFGWYYYIDGNNIYHRGTYFLIAASITFLLMIAASVITMINRKKIGMKVFFSLIFFPIPPIVCIVLQTLLYGFSFVLNSVVISLLIVFMNIQSQSIYTDYLTGVNNRKKLEAYLKEKVNSSNAEKTFSAILIDLDNFKMINDTFGHDMGDDALETSARLLNSCIRSEDFIARFGGDEFCIVLDVADKNDLEAMIRRIDACVQRYNETGDRPYQLAFSMGYAVYDYGTHLRVKEFQKQIDQLMYENKRKMKSYQ